MLPSYTSLNLGHHMDLLYFESPPGLQFLHSLQNSTTGGESVFSDSFRAAELMRIKRFKRNGESWVRFYLAIDTAHSHPIERPLARVSKIKRRAGDYDPDEDKNYTARPVIALDICMGTALRSIEVNLTDRSAFQYPLLIGSEALKRFDALVDPSLKYAAPSHACASPCKTAACRWKPPSATPCCTANCTARTSSRPPA